MISGTARPSRDSQPNRRRGSALIAVVVPLFVLGVVVLMLTSVGAGDHDLTVHRLRTVQTFYAAEAGVNMAMREVIIGHDQDGDGALGTISDDATDANDPAFGPAQVVVTATTTAGQTTYTSLARADRVRREAQALIDDD